MAVFLFWITIWQFASMYLGQEIPSGISCFCCPKAFELSFTGNFWQSVGFSFVVYCDRILWLCFWESFWQCWHIVKNSGNLIAPVICGGQIYICGVFYHFVPDMDTVQKSVSFISFLMVLPQIYTNILEGIRQTDSKILEMAKVFQVNPKERSDIYVSQVLPYSSACRLSLGMC